MIVMKEFGFYSKKLLYLRKQNISFYLICSKISNKQKHSMIMQTSFQYEQHEIVSLLQRGENTFSTPFSAHPCPGKFPWEEKMFILVIRT